MILRAGVKNIREIQRFRPKRLIHSEVNPKIPHWETARALTLTERLEGTCSIKNYGFLTENSIIFERVIAIGSLTATVSSFK